MHGICANQLGRRNLTEETRKFLIGMQYESEKVANSMRNAQRISQYTEIESPRHSKPATFVISLPSGLPRNTHYPMPLFRNMVHLPVRYQRFRKRLRTSPQTFFPAGIKSPIKT